MDVSAGTRLKLRLPDDIAAMLGPEGIQKLPGTEIAFRSGRESLRAVVEHVEQETSLGRLGLIVTLEIGQPLNQSEPDQV